MNFCQNMQVVAAAASVTAKQMPKNYYPKQLENVGSNRQNGLSSNYSTKAKVEVCDHCHYQYYMFFFLSKIT